MARYSPCSKHAIVLRMMVFGAGVLAVLLAGATWVADVIYFTPSQLELFQTSETVT